MDNFSAWLHNYNIDHTLDRFGTYVDPSTRTALLKFLIDEEERLGTGPDQFERTERRVREGEVRISRILAIIERLIDYGLMDQERFSKAVTVVTTMHDSQVLLAQLYRHMSDCTKLATRSISDRHPDS